MGKLIALGGSFATACLLVATLLIVVHSSIAGQPLHGGEWFAVAIFGGLSLVVVAIVVAAWRNTRRHSEAAPLMWVAVALLLGGAGVGAYVGYQLSSGRVETLDAIERRACARALGATLDAKRLAACRPLAQRCRWKHANAKAGSGPEQLARLKRIPKHIRPPRSPRAVQELLCLLEALERR